MPAAAASMLFWSGRAIASPDRPGTSSKCSTSLNRIDVEFVIFREKIDTGGPLGRAIVIIIGAIAELERSLIVERVRAGMRRARLEGQRIGRAPLVLDNAAIQQDRQRGQSIRQIAKGHSVSTATIQRVLRKHAPTTREHAA